MVNNENVAPDVTASIVLTALPPVRPETSRYKDPGNTTCKISATTIPIEIVTKNARPPVESTLP